MEMQLEREPESSNCNVGEMEMIGKKVSWKHLTVQCNLRKFSKAVREVLKASSPVIRVPHLQGTILLCYLCCAQSLSGISPLEATWGWISEGSIQGHWLITLSTVGDLRGTFS